MSVHISALITLRQWQSAPHSIRSLDGDYFSRLAREPFTNAMAKGKLQKWPCASTEHFAQPTHLRLSLKCLTRKGNSEHQSKVTCGPLKMPWIFLSRINLIINHKHLITQGFSVFIWVSVLTDFTKKSDFYKANFVIIFFLFQSHIAMHLILKSWSENKYVKIFSCSVSLVYTVHFLGRSCWHSRLCVTFI